MNIEIEPENIQRTVDVGIKSAFLFLITENVSGIEDNAKQSPATIPSNSIMLNLKQFYKIF